MRFIIAILLTSLLSFLGGLFFPWWGIAIAGFAVAIVVQQGPGRAFLSGFLGVMLLWCLLAFIKNSQNEGVLGAKIATVLPLGGNAILLILVTGLVGGIVGGFAAMTGSYLLPVRSRRRKF